MEKEKIILEIFELEELIKITTDKKELKKLKTQYTKLNNKLKDLKEEL
jgi:predicted  nucleic acid-binding Zn-ribbon protein